jgi:NADH-quinone oxidoreductase subunit F
MSENIQKLSARKSLEKNLFGELVLDAKNEGTPSEEKLKELGDDFLLSSSVTRGTASFYDFLKPENRGKKAYVCSGSACMTKGNQENLKSKLSEEFGNESIGHMACLGRCHEGNAFHVDGKNYSGEALQNLSKLEEFAEDNYFVGSFASTNLLTDNISSVDDYFSDFFDSLQDDSGNVLSEIKKANLRGRGGAGFPIDFKLESCKNTESSKKFIVCNADEGDPGAYSDKYLLEKQPYKVLLGMMISGFVTGAESGYLYIRAEYPDSILKIEEAIQVLKDKKFIGKNIKGSSFSFEFYVVKGAGAYICGEETALLNSIEGRRPEVRTRPPFPTVEGLFGEPTIVNNVETLASLPFILSHGGKAFKEIGTEKSSGTKLVSLDHNFKRPGIYEVDMGTSLSTVIEDFGEGFREKIKAMQIGGPLGGVVPNHMIDKLRIDFESFSENRFLLGHASIVSIPKSFPMIDFVHHLFEFTKDESCGKCFPCRLGSKRGTELVEFAKNENKKIDQELFTDLLETMQEGSLCALGGGLPLPIKNILENFHDEIKPYFV